MTSNDLLKVYTSETVKKTLDVTFKQVRPKHKQLNTITAEGGCIACYDFGLIFNIDFNVVSKQFTLTVEEMCCTMPPLSANPNVVVVTSSSLNSSR